MQKTKKLKNMVELLVCVERMVVMNKEVERFKLVMPPVAGLVSCTARYWCKGNNWPFNYQKSDSSFISWRNFDVPYCAIDVILNEILSNLSVFQGKVEISFEDLWCPITQYLYLQSTPSYSIQVARPSPTKAVSWVQGRVQACLSQQSLQPGSKGLVGDEAWLCPGYSISYLLSL